MFNEMVRAEVKIAVNIAREAFPHAHIPMPIVEFSNRLTKTGGKCIYSNRVYTVRFSTDIMERNDISAYISQVVYHEVAHMVDRQVYNNWGHGATFYRIMTNTFGKRGKEAGRTHSFKTRETQRRKTKKYNYKCPTCGEVFALSAVRHGKAKKGTSYSHKGHASLQYIGEHIDN
jgi:predicted SprT family Zn-dependent metalloprotease